MFPTINVCVFQFCSNDGSILAIASSYTFEEGDKDHPDDIDCISAAAQAHGGRGRAEQEHAAGICARVVASLDGQDWAGPGSKCTL